MIILATRRPSTLQSFEFRSMIVLFKEVDAIRSDYILLINEQRHSEPGVGLQGEMIQKSNIAILSSKISCHGMAWLRVSTVSSPR